MADRWLYTRSGNRFGPVSSAVLKQLADAGELTTSDLVSKEGTQRWVPASRVKGLFTVAPEEHPQETYDLQGDGRQTLDRVVARAEDRAEIDPTEDEGQLELDGPSRFFLMNPLGLPAWIAFIGIATLALTLMLIEMDGARGLLPGGWIAIIDVAFAALGLGIYAGLRASLGKKTACPRCARWFSKLLIKAEDRVVHSRPDTMTYTGQAAIRDRNFRVTGYVDEQRTMPVTVQTVVRHRAYRCKACHHRWETSDVDNVIA